MKVPLKMWSIDVAREQPVTRLNLANLCRLSLESGYNAIGLYLEHRFQYDFLPKNPFSDLLSADDIKKAEKEFPEIQIIPMINVLGHTEGFLRMEGYQSLSEEPFKGLQACPSQPGSAQLAKRIIDSVASAFHSELIHIGGDETAALGVCPQCSAKVADFEKGPDCDGKAKLYSDYHNPLLEYVKSLGRTPAIWGDMLLEHPQSLASVPKETVVFDWQYFESPLKTSTVLLEAGLRVVTCPTIHAYNASWLHLDQSQSNVSAHIEVSRQIKTEGICLTTWEPGLMGMMETWIPAILAFGKQISGEKRKVDDEYIAIDQGEWLTLMKQIPEAAPSFAYSGTRSSVKCRFLLYSNPFLLWLRNKDLIEQHGETARQLLLQAETSTTHPVYRATSAWPRLAIEFCQHANAASLHYANSNLGQCQNELQVCRQTFEALERMTTIQHQGLMGSEADTWRCRNARSHIEKVMKNIRDFGDGSLGYRPSFEHLSHPKFVPHDQGAWWLVNSWANE